MESGGKGVVEIKTNVEKVSKLTTKTRNSVMSKKKTKRVRLKEEAIEDVDYPEISLAQDYATNRSLKRPAPVTQLTMCFLD